MNPGVTFLARAVVYLMAIGALAVCAILLPEIAREVSVEDPALAYLKYPFLAGAYVMAIPFFVALQQTHQLLRYIDEQKAFSGRSVKALQNIKTCAIVFSGLVLIGAVTGNYLIGKIYPDQDITHVIVIGFIFTFAASVVATFAAVLQRVLQNAIAIKDENDLTV